VRPLKGPANQQIFAEAFPTLHEVPRVKLAPKPAFAVSDFGLTSSPQVLSLQRRIDYPLMQQAHSQAVAGDSLSAANG
jgi:hypothetical protein